MKDCLELIELIVPQGLTQICTTNPSTALDLQIVYRNLPITHQIIIIIIPNLVIITTQNLAITTQNLAIIITSLQVHHQEVTFLGRVIAHPLVHLTLEVVVGFHQVLAHREVVNLEDNFKKIYYEM